MKSERLSGKSREECLPPKLILLVSILIAAFSFASCGKKGPPVPPDMELLPKISSLRAEVSGDKLRLVWDAPVEGAFADPDGYYVYRATRSVSDECEDCPDNFQEVAYVPSTSGFWGTRSKKPTYEETLRKGNRYRYKIAAGKDSGAPGDFSNTVEVEY